MANVVQWNLDLTNCQGTREMGLYIKGSRYRGSVPYILKSRALYRGLPFMERFVKSRVLCNMTCNEKKWLHRVYFSVVL